MLLLDSASWENQEDAVDSYLDGQSHYNSFSYVALFSLHLAESGFEKSPSNIKILEFFNWKVQGIQTSPPHPM